MPMSDVGSRPMAKATPGVRRPSAITGTAGATPAAACRVSARVNRMDSDTRRLCLPGQLRLARDASAATVSAVNGGWQAVPGGSDGEAAFRLAPVEPGRVVGLGAI